MSRESRAFTLDIKITDILKGKVGGRGVVEHIVHFIDKYERFIGDDLLHLLYRSCYGFKAIDDDKNAMVLSILDIFDMIIPSAKNVMSNTTTVSNVADVADGVNNVSKLDSLLNIANILNLGLDEFVKTTSMFHTDEINELVEDALLRVGRLGVVKEVIDVESSTVEVAVSKASDIANLSSLDLFTKGGVSDEKTTVE